MNIIKVWHFKSLDVGGPGGAIYLPYLVLHHTAWEGNVNLLVTRSLV